MKTAKIYAYRQSGNRKQKRIRTESETQIEWKCTKCLKIAYNNQMSQKDMCDVSYALMVCI